MTLSAIKLSLLFLFHFIPPILAFSIFKQIKDAKYIPFTFLWLLVSIFPVGLMFYTLYLFFIDALIMIAVSIFLLIPILLINAIIFLILNRHSRHFKKYLTGLIVLHIILALLLQ